jgi:UDP-N-acetylmuramyl pentapeptide phosphotransferase/UDP-N-acetylglucosamine-1-phosphate transferase
MDGINGITGAYSLVVLGSFWFLNEYRIHFTNSSFILCAIIACLVFLFFNFRKKARCFAGDIGSVSIGFWIITLLLMITIRSNELKYLFFLAVYGVDTICTILHRVILKQNIFEAHRLHFYQILANEKKMPHLYVATLYAVLQLLINAVVIFTNFNFAITAAILCIPLVLGYIVIKSLLMAHNSLTS